MVSVRVPSDDSVISVTLPYYDKEVLLVYRVYGYAWTEIQSNFSQQTCASVLFMVVVLTPLLIVVVEDSEVNPPPPPPLPPPPENELNEVNVEDPNAFPIDGNPPKGSVPNGSVPNGCVPNESIPID